MLRLLLITAIFGSACTPSVLGGKLRADGYHHNLLPIHLRSSSGRAQQYVSPDWQLDNFRNEAGDWTQKEGPGYSTDVVVDLRGDRTDARRPQHTTQTPVFDVLLKHRRNGAQLWMRTELLPEPYRERTLESLVAAYAEQLSGTAFVGVAVYPVSVAVSRGYATKIVSSGATKVGDRDAYEAVIEVANLDQLRLDPQSRSLIMHVVFVESGYDLYQSGPRGRARGRAIVVLGYSATPSAYEESHEDFARFRAELVLGSPDRNGYVIE
ncbi:MAG: hypothetical protein JXB32_06965 [Deltaproteobacteria bacterium]|nr:hypothetical protein [Deltaproteobacteria bacterium]